MTSPAPLRRLAAILAADMVGYSRLMEQDEAGTVARFKADREEFIDPTIAVHGGRIVRLAGDGALVEFPGVVEAAQCAIDIQRGMPERNARRSEDKHIVFRIGVNTGDIIVEDDNLHGEGINVAARLESLCEPGGILLSEQATRYVDGKIGAGLEFVEERTVKNIGQPVRIWRVRLDDSPGSSLGTAMWQGRRLIRKTVVVAGIVFATLVAALLWYEPWAPRIEPDSGEQRTLPLPDKPSIAVLPFTNMSGDAEQEYFADGMTEDLITDLSKISGLFVIARNSTFTYKGRTDKPVRVAQELGVRYVLEGSVRRAKTQIRINAQLIDATTGGHVWADRFDGVMADVFSLQDEVNRKIVEALAINLTVDDRKRLDKIETLNPDAYDMLLRGLDQYQRFDRESNARARETFKAATALDGSYARAYANVALTYVSDVNFNWTNDREESIQLGLEYAARALDLDKNIPQIYLTRSILYLAQRRHAAAVEAGRRTIEVHPNYADGYAALAFVLSYAGQLEEALEAIYQAKHINPHYSHVYLAVEGRILFLLGRYEEAAIVLEEAVQRNPVFDRIQLHLAATYAQLGKLDEAAWATEEALAIRSDISIADERSDANYKRSEDLNHYIEALRKAGVPER